jgi:hypothetical protein
VIIAAAGLAGTIVLWTAAQRLNHHAEQLSIAPNFHVTATRRGFNGYLIVFNDLKNSPHRGLSAVHGFDSRQPLPGVDVWRSAPELLATATTGPASYRWYTVYVNLNYPMALFAIPPLVWLLRRRTHAARGFPVAATSKAPASGGLDWEKEAESEG